MLYVLAIWAVWLILDPQSFLGMVAVCAVIYLLAPPHWKRPPTNTKKMAITVVAATAALGGCDLVDIPFVGGPGAFAHTNKGYPITVHIAEADSMAYCTYTSCEWIPTPDLSLLRPSVQAAIERWSTALDAQDVQAHPNPLPGGIWITDNYAGFAEWSDGGTTIQLPETLEGLHVIIEWSDPLLMGGAVGVVNPFLGYTAPDGRPILQFVSLSALVAIGEGESLILHELGHALGFLGSAQGAARVLAWVNERRNPAFPATTVPISGSHWAEGCGPVQDIMHATGGLVRTSGGRIGAIGDVTIEAMTFDWTYVQTDVEYRYGKGGSCWN